MNGFSVDMPVKKLEALFDGILCSERAGAALIALRALRLHRAPFSPGGG